MPPIGNKGKLHIRSADLHNRKGTERKSCLVIALFVVITSCWNVCKYVTFVDLFVACIFRGKTLLKLVVPENN